MNSSQPIVCVFFKLPPSHHPILRIYEIAWNIFLPQLNRINEAFEAAQAVHPSTEAKKFWSEARENASKNMSKLQEISFACHETAFSFLRFLDALHNGRDNSDSYQSFRDSASKVVWRSGIAQEGMLEFREDIRIAVSRITTILSDDDRDISSFMTESGQSLLELATGVEECNAVLEEYREEFKEVHQQRSDVNNNSPSEEEFRMVQQKWQVFKEISGPNAYRWQTLKREMRAPKGRDKPTRRSYNSTSPTTPAGSSKSRRIPFWRKLFYRTISYIPLEKLC